MEFNATFIVSIVSFLLFVAIMNKIFYAPITKIVNEREEKLKINYDEADKLNAEAETLLKERDKKLAETEAKSRHIIADKIEDYNARSKVKINEAAQNAATEIKLRKDALSQSELDAEQKLNSDIQSLAQLISSKIMGIDVNIATVNNSNGVKQ